MAFIMRTSKPEAGNKYYIRKAQGGYSNAICGSPTDRECNVLANCVGYAYGRFNEIGGYGYCKYLAPVNAEKFMSYKGSCKVGQTPKLGACMVWQKGSTLNGSDGAGHVAIVEKVISDTEVYTSESGYGSSKPFWNQTRKKGSGNWGCGSGYKFLGFIYNPAVPDSSPNVSVKPDVVYQVYTGGRWLSEITNYNEKDSNGYAGIFGKEISGLRIRLSNGNVVTVRSHLKGKSKSDWLSPITKWDDGSLGYSGWKNKPTDCVAMEAEGVTLKYRVHVKGGKWLGWITKYDIKDSVNGMAGIYGKAIDAIQIVVV